MDKNIKIGLNTVLFVDDEENILNSLKRVFRKEGYNTLYSKSGKEGLNLFHAHRPGIVVSDQQMPEMTGVEFLKRIRELAPHTLRILLTGYADINATIKAVNEGEIYRYLSKPWDDNEIRLIIRQAANDLNMKEENKRLTILTEQQNKELKFLNLNLEKKVKARTAEISEKNESLKKLYDELENNFNDFIRTFIGVLEIYNPSLGNHSKRVSAISRLVAKKLKLDEKTVQNIEVAAILHDIGMIGIPAYILDASFTELKEEEKEIFMHHSVIGEATFSSMKSLERMAFIIRTHHERYDGNGFPDHLKKDEIPLESCIISIVDTYDEVKTLGIYKKDPDHRNPSIFIKNNAGKRFDSSFVGAFFEVIEELKLRASGEKEAPISVLREGMIVSRDIMSSNGIFLIAKDTILKEAYIKKIKAYNKMSPIQGKIFIYDKK